MATKKGQGRIILVKLLHDLAWCHIPIELYILLGACFYLITRYCETLFKVHRYSALNSKIESSLPEGSEG